MSAFVPRRRLESGHWMTLFCWAARRTFTCAVAGLLARRDRLAIVLLLAGAVVHSTTALWFFVWLGVAAWFCRPAWRPALLACAAAGVVGGVIAVTAGPLRADLARMELADIGWRTTGETT